MTIRRLPILTLGLVLLGLPLEAPSEPRITLVSGSRPDGAATDLWLAILRRRLTQSRYDSVAAICRGRTAEERAWADLIDSQSRRWPRLAVPLLGLFDSTAVDSVRVVLGNRGGEDAFTHDSMTIGFDLAALQRVYGAAAAPENAERLDRFFRHEFVHLLQKRWLARHPFPLTSPFRVALFDAWAEGLGNYFSLSAQWQPNEHAPSARTSRVLAALQPRFVARMAALPCADSTSAVSLLADLSSGPFEQKWGALPVALWLLADADTNPRALHAFAEAGPGGVLALAERHLPRSLADSLPDPSKPARECTMQGPPPCVRAPR